MQYLEQEMLVIKLGLFCFSIKNFCMECLEERENKSNFKMLNLTKLTDRKFRHEPQRVS